MMVGRNVAVALDIRERGTGNGEPYLRGASVPGSQFPVPALQVQNLTVPSPRKPNEVDAVSFTVARGEILGIAGVEGNGQTELIEAITGLRAATSGTISIADAEGALRDITTRTVRARADSGLSHIPEDRHRRGLVLEYSVADNLILGQQHRFTGGASTLDHQRIATN